MCIVGADMPVGKQMDFEPFSPIEGILGDISATSMGGKQVPTPIIKEPQGIRQKTTKASKGVKCVATKAVSLTASAGTEKKKFVHPNKGVPMTKLEIWKSKSPKTSFTHKSAAGSGGREQKPDPLAMRQIMVVMVHHDGLFKEMWDISAHNSIITAQYVKLYAALRVLIGICPVEYATAPEIGHPWFDVGNHTSYLKKISISMEQYICLWSFVCAKNSKEENMQQSVNKIILSAAFSQQVIKNTHVEFTFKASLWQKNAPSMMHGGKGGGGKGGGGKNVNGRLKLGRPSIQPVYTCVALVMAAVVAQFPAHEGAAVTAMTPLIDIQMRAPRKLIVVESTIQDAREFFKNATSIAPSPNLVASATALAEAAATLASLSSPIRAVPPVEYKVW